MCHGVACIDHRSHARSHGSLYVSRIFRLTPLSYNYKVYNYISVYKTRCPCWWYSPSVRAQATLAALAYCWAAKVVPPTDRQTEDIQADRQMKTDRQTDRSRHLRLDGTGRSAGSRCERGAPALAMLLQPSSECGRETLLCWRAAAVMLMCAVMWPYTLPTQACYSPPRPRPRAGRASGQASSRPLRSWWVSVWARPRLGQRPAHFKDRCRLQLTVQRTQQQGQQRAGVRTGWKWFVTLGTDL